MPGRQVVAHAGLAFQVSPDFWLRRVTNFPFYFESHNPAFRVEIERISEPPDGQIWIGNKIGFEVVFADGSTWPMPWDVPELKIGQATKMVLPPIYTAAPGQTIIKIVVREQPFFSVQPAEFKTLYSYQVRTEEQLWLSGFGTLLAVLTAIGASAPGWLRLFS